MIKGRHNVVFKRMADFTEAQLKHFLQGKWDVTLLAITEGLEISEGERDALVTALDDLEKEGWITKSFCKTHQAFEYDPGPSQEP